MRRANILVAFVAALLLFISKSQATEPVGAERCGSCHTREYEDWLSSPHARSFRSLSLSQQKDPTCRTCHTLAPSSDNPAFEGVQCESCHGVGNYYAPEYVMRDGRLSRLLGLTDITPAICQSCHENVEAKLKPVDYTTMIEAVSHKTKPVPARSTLPVSPRRPRVRRP